MMGGAVEGVLVVVGAGWCGVQATATYDDWPSTLSRWSCGLMDKALVFGTKDCRLESCQDQFYLYHTYH